MKISSKPSSLFVAFSVVLCAAPQGAFAQATMRPVMAPTALSLAAPLATLNGAQSPSSLSAVNAVAPLVPSILTAAPVLAPQASVMTQLTSNAALLAETARTGTNPTANRQISDSMFTGSNEKKDQTETPVVDGADETNLSEVLAANGMRLPTSSTPYEKLAALFDYSHETISKNDLIGWHAGRFFSKDKPQDSQHTVIVGSEVDAVKDGGPLFNEKVLKVAVLRIPAGEKAEALSAKTIENLKGKLDGSQAVSPGNKVEYEWTQELLPVMRNVTHTEIRRNGRYLILKQVVTEIVDAESTYFKPGTYQHTVYAYFFKDVTPHEPAPYASRPARYPMWHGF